MSQPIRIGRRTFTPLFPGLLRPMTAGERQALKNDIRKRGVVVPLVVGEQDGIIDGLNRAEVAAEVGLDEVRVDVRTLLTIGQKRDLCLALNDARRHLSPADRKKVKELRKARAAAKRAGGKTLEAIAQEEGVDISQVRRDLAQSVLSFDKTDPTPDAPPPVEPIASEEGEEEDAQELMPEPAPMPTVQRVTGKDGKSYPAKKPRKKTQPALDPDTNPEARVSQGKGVALAHEAINCLGRIPKSDGLRIAGYRIVWDWLKRNNPDAGDCDNWTPLDHLRRAWAACSAEERQTFLAEVTAGQL